MKMFVMFFHKLNNRFSNNTRFLDYIKILPLIKKIKQIRLARFKSMIYFNWLVLLLAFNVIILEKIS